MMFLNYIVLRCIATVSGLTKLCQLFVHLHSNYSHRQTFDLGGKGVISHFGFAGVALYHKAGHGTLWSHKDVRI